MVEGFENYIDEIMANFIERLHQLAEEDYNLPSIPSDLNRLKIEFQRLIILTNKFPKTKSYTLGEIFEILDNVEFGLIKSSSTFLRVALQILDQYNLLAGTFIDQLGVLDLTTDTQTESLSINQIDQKACLGVNAIEKPSIFMNYIYKYNECPFCKEPVRVEQIKTFTLIENLKGGITLSILNKGENAAYHLKN